MPVLSLSILDAMIVEEVSEAPSAISGRNTEIKHHSDDSGLILIDDQHIYLVLALVEDAALFQPVSVWCVSASEPSFFNHLPKGCFGTH